MTYLPCGACGSALPFKPGGIGSAISQTKGLLFGKLLCILESSGLFGLNSDC